MKENDKKLSSDEIAVYDTIQLSIKISANSFYGILGAKGLLFCPQIARSTTACGRLALETAKDFVE